VARRERVLDQPTLNRVVLARQLLLERTGLTIPKALDRMAGIQAQYAPSMYVRLWGCLEGFARDDLTRALERRTVVQATMMRATIHLVSADDYWPLTIAIRDGRRDWYLRVARDHTAADIERAADELREAFADGPLTRKEMESVVGRTRIAGVGMFLDLVRVPPSGTWERRRADLFHLASAWLGPEPAISKPDAQVHLVRRYLGGFGPSTVAEIADFAGLPPKEVAAVVESMALRRFRSE
jgi:hypothetical protein